MSANMNMEQWADIRTESPPPEPDPHLEHLQAELSRIDILLAFATRRWALADQDAHDDYRGIYVTPAEVIQLLDRPFAANWGDTATVPPDLDQAFRIGHAQAAQRADSVAESMLKRGITPRLYQLAKAFHLDRLALDILLLALAPAFDPRYQRIYGFLQDHVARRRPTVRLVLDIFGATGLSRFALAERFSAAAPLSQFALVELVVEPPPRE